MILPILKNKYCNCKDAERCHIWQRIQLINQINHGWKTNKHNYLYWQSVFLSSCFANQPMPVNPPSKMHECLHSSCLPTKKKYKVLELRNEKHFSPAKHITIKIGAALWPKMLETYLIKNSCKTQNTLPFLAVAHDWG